MRFTKRTVSNRLIVLPLLSAALVPVVVVLALVEHVVEPARRGGPPPRRRGSVAGGAGVAGDFSAALAQSRIGHRRPARSRGPRLPPGNARRRPCGCWDPGLHRPR